MIDTTNAVPTGTASTDAPVSILDQGDAVHERPAPKRATRVSGPPRERPEDEDEIQASEDADTPLDDPDGLFSGDQGGDEGEADGAAEAEPSEGDEPETESEREPRYVRADERTRLSDGTVIKVGDLKRAHEERQVYEARLNGDFQARARDLDVLRQRQAQINQYLEQQLQQVVAQATAAIPPAPDERLRETDPFAFQQQWIDRRDAIERYHARNQQLQQLQQQHAAQTQQQFGAYVQQETETFFRIAPELREPERMKAFRKDAHEVLRKYGFRPEEIDGNADHRVVWAYRDLIEFHKLKAAQAKGKEALRAKTAGAPPVQRPPVQNGIRQSAGSREARSVQDLRRLQRDPNASARDRQRAGEALLSRYD